MSFYTDLDGRDGVEIQPVPRPPRTPSEGHVPGEVGLWVFILGDMLMFALFFGAIVVLRGEDTEMFRESQHHLHPALGVLNTALLLTGSILVVRGLMAVRRAEARARPYFLATVVCAVGFAMVKAIEYTELIHAGYTAGSNDFFMYYFVFTGIHLAHLVIGTILLLLLAGAARGRPLTERQTAYAECGACYWHMVDLLWLVLFPLLYLVR